MSSEEKNGEAQENRIDEYARKYELGKYNYVHPEPETAEERDERERMEWSYGNFSARGPLPHEQPRPVLPDEEYNWLKENYPEKAENYQPAGNLRSSASSSSGCILLLCVIIPVNIFIVYLLLLSR